MAAALAVLERPGGDERLADIRDEMARSMSAGIGIYRTAEGMQATCETLDGLMERLRDIRLDDHNRAFNTEWLSALELGFSLEVARAMAYSAVERRESRGAHMRLDEFNRRDDQSFLKHTLAHFDADGPPQITYEDVKITRLPPAERHYGAAAQSPGKAGHD